jgi:hypothetical protein
MSNALPLINLLEYFTPHFCKEFTQHSKFALSTRVHQIQYIKSLLSTIHVGEHSSLGCFNEENTVKNHIDNFLQTVEFESFPSISQNLHTTCNRMENRLHQTREK